MNDATLDLCVRKSRFNSLSETCQTIHAEQKYILNSTGFEFVQRNRQIILKNGAVANGKFSGSPNHRNSNIVYKQIISQMKSQ